MFTKISQKSLKISKTATAVSTRAVAKRSFAVSAKTQEYIDMEKKHVAFYYNVPELVVERGERIYLWDIEGNRYYDMLGGFASVS
jgi:4-aminobutyrate aminotransferase-like enzyme